MSNVERCKRNVYGISSALLIIGLIFFLISMVDMWEFFVLMIVGASLFGLGLVLIIDFYIANLFFKMAVDKGYPDLKYLFMAFILPAIGYLLIVAMPDRATANKQDPSGDDFKASLERVEMLKVQGVLTEDEAAKMRADILAGIV